MVEAEAEEERRVAEAAATEDIKARGSKNGGDNGGMARLKDCVALTGHARW